MKVLFVLVIGVLSSMALGNGYVTKNKTGKIVHINSETSGVRIKLSATDLDSPDNCSIVDTVFVDTSTEAGQRHYSTLLSAFMADRSIGLYSNGCHTGWGNTYQNISALYVY